jgi:hypothetical protein
MFSFFSCNNTIEKPKNLIEKDKMTKILYDLSLLDAMKNQYIEGGISNQKANDYIYKKYKIDSIQFSQNNKYYASDVKNYKKMFEKVKDRLQNESNKLDTLMKKKGEKVIPKFNTNTLNSEEPQVQ